jgi:hypothetical protein
MEQDEIEQQLERCRRLASEITDDDLRRSLARLVSEYEAQLNQRSGSFMLGPASPRS